VDNLLHTVRHDLTIAASSTEQSAKRAIRCLQVHRDHLVTQTDGRAANVARHSASYLHPGFSSYLVCYSAVSLRRSATPRPIWARWSAAAQCGQMPAPDSRRRTRSKDFGIANYGDTLSIAELLALRKQRHRIGLRHAAGLGAAPLRAHPPAQAALDLGDETLRAERPAGGTPVERAIAVTSPPLARTREDPQALDFFRWNLFQTSLDNESLARWRRSWAGA
jgi:hypothetical protein